MTHERTDNPPADELGTPVMTWSKLGSASDVTVYRNWSGAIEVWMTVQTVHDDLAVWARASMVLSADDARSFTAGLLAAANGTEE